MNFADAVRNVPELAECLKAGLQALGSNSNKVEVRATRDLTGSVDIDTCLTKHYPNAPRWDYVFGYKNRIYYLEVHPGITSEVNSVIAKLNWLKQWRKRSAKSLEDLEHCSSYHWIASGRITVRRNSKYHRLLRNKGILLPDSILRVDAIS